MTDVQPQQPQTALDLWTEQVRGLADPATADDSINSIYNNLMSLHDKLTANGMEKQAAKVADAYNMALGIYNHAVQQSAVIAGGTAAITGVDEQRKQAVTELQQLLKAIDDQDESHPKLAPWISEITEAADEYAMEYAEETLTDDVEENIASEWSFSFEKAQAVWMAVLGRKKLTDDQQTLFKAFANSLIVEEEEEWNEEDIFDPDADTDGDA